MLRIRPVFAPALLVGALACNPASQRPPAAAPADVTPTPTTGVRSSIVREAPQPVERIVPGPTPTPTGP